MTGRDDAEVVAGLNRLYKWKYKLLANRWCGADAIEISN